MTTNEDIGEYKNWSEEFPNGGNSTWPYPGVVGLMLDYDGKDNFYSWVPSQLKTTAYPICESIVSVTTTAAPTTHASFNFQ